MTVYKKIVVEIFDYLYWANHKLLDAAAELPPELFTAATSVTTRDLRATLVHELDVEWSWRLALQGISSSEMDALDELDPERYPDVNALRTHWSRDEAEMREWLGSLTDEGLVTDVTPCLSSRRRPLHDFLLHIVFHAAQQQADAATLLTSAGRSPGDTGYLEYLSARTGAD